MGQYFSNPEIAAFEKDSKDEICHAEFNADELAEQTNFTNLEIKFIYHIYYNAPDELLHQNPKLNAFLRSTVNRHTFKNFIYYLDGITHGEKIDESSDEALGSDQKRKKSMRMIVESDDEGHRISNKQRKEIAKSKASNSITEEHSNQDKWFLAIRHFMTYFEADEDLDVHFAYLIDIIDDFGTVQNLEKEPTHEPTPLISEKIRNEMTQRHVEQNNEIDLGSRYSIKNTHPMRRFLYNHNKFIHSVNAKTASMFFSTLGGDIRELIKQQKRVECQIKPNTISEEDLSFRSYVKKTNYQNEPLRFIKTMQTSLEDPSKNPLYQYLQVPFRTVNDFLSFLTEPIETILQTESNLHPSQIETISRFQTTLLALILKQKAIFLPLIEKIRSFLQQFASSNYELEGTLRVKEGNLAITSRWSSYRYHLQGGLLSQQSLLNKQKTIVRSFVFLYGTVVEKIYIEEAKHLTHIRNNTSSYIIRITQSRNKPDILITTEDEANFEKWYWSLLYFSLQVQHNRYDGYYPVRYNINATWFVNAKPLFERLADAIEAAKKEIFLTNWWTSPEVYLRRGANTQLKDRFDQMLKRKAEEGVRIYMILWNETKVAQEGLMNRYAAQVFSSMHSNFKIMMHPVQEPIIWAHHQKSIVIDQSIAFQGGIDVCWGRWDDRNHRIADPCHTRMEWPGKDYFNPLIQAIEDTYNPYFDTIDRTRQPRMPWHDIQMEVDGLAARDVALNFIERWNYSRQNLIDVEMNLANKLVIRKQYPVLTLMSKPPYTSTCNWYENLHELPECRRVLQKELDILNPVLEWELLQKSSNNFKLNTRTCKVQILRSMSLWSCASRTEASIYLAYLDIIGRAQHYILIENQYFCSSTAGHGVINRVAEAIVDRVRWAILNKKKFRVFLIVPAQPDGPLKDSSTVRCIQYYTMNSICRGGTSIIETLENEFPHINISEYVSPVSLRTHDEIDGIPVTEQVYVHAKAIIVDDKYALIGSANLNDRSFLGNRDSEIAALVEDSVKVKITMDNQPYLADRFALTFRMYLFREFLGLDEQDNSVLDPISDSTFQLWKNTAASNTKIYQQVFPFIPSDLIETWDQLQDKDLELHIPHPERISLLKKIKGILIQMPRKMLNDGSLAPHLFDYEQKILNSYIFQ